MKSYVSKEKVKLKSFSKSDKKNTKIFKTLSTKNKDLVYANKNIIIKDVTSNYNNINSNLMKSFNNKRNAQKINKQNPGNISIDIIKLKKNRINKAHKESIIKNNTINEFKLNNSNFIQEKSKKIFNLSKSNKTFKNIENKKSDIRNLIKNKNKRNNNEFGNSYEFNFTFNNFNNNITQNNFNGSYIKNTNKKSSKLILENTAKKKIINNFTSVRNYFFKDIKEIINEKNNRTFIQKERQNKKSKDSKIGIITKNNEKIKAKDSYSVKIQKIFRGYIFRKKYKPHIQINPKEKINSKSKVYIRKKVINKKSGLNLNTNHNLSNYQNDYHFTEANLVNTKKSENTIKNVKEGNKIEEIIIDKNKLFNVLCPSITKNN